MNFDMFVGIMIGIAIGAGVTKFIFLYLYRNWQPPVDNKKVTMLGSCPIYHDWTPWSDPKEGEYQTYDAPPALVPNAELVTLKSLIQTRKCKKCKKFQWRKV